MKGIVITPENLMHVDDFSAPLYKSVGKAVGGWIEIVHTSVKKRSLRRVRLR